MKTEDYAYMNHSKKALAMLDEPWNMSCPPYYKSLRDVLESFTALRHETKREIEHAITFAISRIGDYSELRARVDVLEKILELKGLT